MVLDRTRLLLGAHLLRISYFQRLSSLLTTAFFFANCFALTTIYCILFVYIRVVAWRVTNLSSTNGSERRIHPHLPWTTNLESGTETSRPNGMMDMTTDRPRLTQPPKIANHAHDHLHKVSKVLLCYPLVYICLTLPTAIIRLGQFAGQPWGLTAAFVAADINLLSGFCNVLLYTTTRKGMVPWNKIFSRGTTGRQKAKDLTNESSWSFPGGLARTEVDSTVEMELPSTITTKSSISSFQSLPPKLYAGKYI